jgi:hypothetical protein
MALFLFSTPSSSGNTTATLAVWFLEFPVLVAPFPFSFFEPFALAVDFFVGASDSVKSFDTVEWSLFPATSPSTGRVFVVSEITGSTSAVGGWLFSSNDVVERKVARVTGGIVLRLAIDAPA